jgi:hypothetical protein
MSLLRGSRIKQRKGCERMKKIIFFMLCLLSLLAFSGCKRKQVFTFPMDRVQSFSVYTYDTEQNTTTSNWVYTQEDMSAFLSYLDNLSGSRVDIPDTALLGSPFYGIELNVDHPYTLLFIGDYAINYEGEYYKIDREKAEKMCRSIVGDTRTSEGINYIVNHRYLSLLDGAWDTTHMMKSSHLEAPLESASLTVTASSIDTSRDQLDIIIENHTGSILEFGSKLDLEVMADNTWYNIDHMINDNVAIGWNSLLIILESGQSLNDTYSLGFHQPLPSGTYRLVKQVRTGSEEHWIAGEFEVE